MGLESTARRWRAGVVSVRQGGDWTSRPAVFLFELAGGWAWVEPSYAGPGGGAPALHMRAGQPEQSGETFRHEADGELLEVAEFDPEADPDLAEVVAWFEGYLQQQGRTLDEERERVRVLVLAETA